MVANLPHVDWAQYLATTSVMKMPPGLLANTRRSFRAKGNLFFHQNSHVMCNETLLRPKLKDLICSIKITRLRTATIMVVFFQEGQFRLTASPVLQTTSLMLFTFQNNVLYSILTTPITGIGALLRIEFSVVDIDILQSVLRPTFSCSFICSRNFLS